MTTWERRYQCAPENPDSNKLPWKAKQSIIGDGMKELNDLQKAIINHVVDVCTKENDNIIGSIVQASRPISISAAIEMDELCERGYLLRGTDFVSLIPTLKAIKFSRER